MRPRRALAAMVFALVAVGSYALQRMWDGVGEPPIGAVLQTTTIPYFWRLATAALHGLGAAVAAGLAADADTAERWLLRAPVLVPAVVLPAVLAMALVP